MTGNWTGGGGGGTLLTKAGSFTGSGSTGNQSVTGVGFQPKVVLFRYNMLGPILHRLIRPLVLASGFLRAIGVWRKIIQTTI